MPPGEEVFKYHGFSGPCPKPQASRPTSLADIPSPVTETYEFGQVLAALRAGRRAARRGWNGKGMFVYLVPGSQFVVNRPPLLGIYPEGTQITYLPHIDMRTADGSCVPWLASQTDILAMDWEIID